MAFPLALIPLLLPLVPKLAEWIGGDRAGGVATQVAEVVASVAGSTDVATVTAALADPAKAGEIAQELARIGAERERAMEEQKTARMAAALADIASARQQTVALADSGSRIAWAAPIMSVVVVFGFFGCVALLFTVEKSWDERTSNLLNIMLGALIPGFAQVLNYWLGSSEGSKRSGDSLRRVAETQANNETQAVAVAAVQAAADAAPSVRSILRR